MSDKTIKVAEEEIDLLALAKTIWRKRRFIIGITFIFMIIGLTIALVTPNEYTATSTFIPQTSESGKPGGSLGGLASLAGINLNGMGGGSEIPPSLYPKIVSSVPFRKALLDATFHVEGLPNTVSYRYFYETLYSPGILDLFKKYTLGLPSLLIKGFNKSEKEKSIKDDIGIIELSKEEFEHFKRLEKQFSVVPNAKDGFVTLSFIMPDPLMAAEMAKFAEDLLQKEIINFKVQNAKEQLRFTEDRFKEKKKEFEEVQSRLANFRDRNQNLSSAAIMNQLQKLEGEYNFAFNVYTEIAKQLEQAKLQVSKDTPVLTIIQPVTVPKEKTNPKRPVILFIFTSLGLVLGIGYVFLCDFLKGIKTQWNQI